MLMTSSNFSKTFSRPVSITFEFLLVEQAIFRRFNQGIHNVADFW